MLRKLCAVLILLFAASPAAAQLSVSFQEGVNGYAGTIDTEFRAANPLDPQGEKDFVSIDEFDGGFQTQGALRFENLFGNQPGRVPTGVTIAFATLTVRVTSSSDIDAILSFDRVLPGHIKPTDIRPEGVPATAPWGELDTWFSLGGDLEPDPITGLLNGDPLLQDGVEAPAIPNEIVPTPNVSGAFVDVDVTDSIQAWYSGALNYGWAINNNTGNGWDFVSSEFVDTVNPADFSFRPMLTIGYFLLEGDLDFDNDVDLDDYEFLLGNLAIQLNGPISQGSMGDLDFDRDVDLDDFSIFKDVYPGGAGGLTSALAARAAVPEPSGVLLAWIAVSTAAMVRRRVPFGPSVEPFEV